jgi:bacteriorhodopsin
MDMSIAPPKDLEHLLQVSRRSLWLALGFIALLGAVGLVLLALPDTKAGRIAASLMSMLPLMMVLALAGLRMKAKGVNMASSNPELRAIRNDELRQASLHKAYRNAFFALLLAQPLLVVLLTVIPGAYPIPMMAGAGSAIGAVVFLASLLYYDR